MVNVERIKKLLKQYFTVTGNTIVNANTGEVTISGNVEYFEPSLRELPVKFAQVNTFLIQNAHGLKTLQGVPKIAKSFTINDAPLLENLQGVPHTMSNFACLNCNNLKTLQGAESIVVHNMMLDNLPITTLEGCPPQVLDIFQVSKCKMLESLKGSPARVKGDFYLLNTPITSLTRGPDWVGGTYVISPYNENLGLLPTLVAQKGIRFYEKNNQAQDVSRIMSDERWRGKGKSNMLNCANELKKNKHMGNARW